MRTSIAAIALVFMAACGQRSSPDPADVLLVNARVYTFSWNEPSTDGTLAAGAPHDKDGWHQDADAIAIKNDRIVFVGSNADAESRFHAADVRDLHGATVVPGLIDAHVHLAELGASLERVNLVGVRDEKDAVDRVATRAATVPKGEWIVGWGWDEGAWASHYPDMTLLSLRVPDHPVVLRGLHSFAVWGNKLAFERARITASTKAPVGGEIRKDAHGQPSGILTNNATALLQNAVPPPTPEQLQARVKKALETLAASGYVSVHEAGADTDLDRALTSLAATQQLPIHVYELYAARDNALMNRLAHPAPAANATLIARGVKAFYDGALGSRGAYLLADYSDQPGHRGRGGAEYGFDRDRMASLMKAGFQLVVHAIGDRANRETLDLIEEVERTDAKTQETRPRIEHAQVLSPDDVRRFAGLGVMASMQPSHAVEDMAWAEQRLGPDRIKGAYAWRSLRRAGTRLAFSSDLPGTDYNIFYGLHSAVTRQDKNSQPAGGWRPEERMTIEEAMRGWTSWAAYAEFQEQDLGTIAVGRHANLTVMDIDPMQVGERDPARLLSGKILMTIVNGKTVFPAR